MILKVEPGAKPPVSAVSPLPELFATARIAPVEGRSTTIELRAFLATAERASASAVGLIVVLTTEVFTGFRSVVVVPVTALPDASAISTAMPAVPCPLGAFFCSAALMFCSAFSEYAESFVPVASTTLPAPGGTDTTASFSPSVRFGARIDGVQRTDQPSDCLYATRLEEYVHGIVVWWPVTLTVAVAENGTVPEGL